MRRSTLPAVALPALAGAALVPWLASAGAAGAAVQFSSGGSDAQVTQTVNDFRAALGALNPNNPQSFIGGRREINWDGVPDANSSPNPFPGDFFNGAVAGRARGIVSSTPGASLQVSADSDNPTATPVDFSNIDPSYLNLFRPFSNQRLFMPIGSNVVENRFFLPGTSTPAAINAFGVVFTDVNTHGSTLLGFFDVNDNLIHSAIVPTSAAGAEGFSFYGARFDAGELISRVVIVSGTHALGAGVLDNPAGNIDLVAMDDFIYSEPIAVPTPSALCLAAAAGGLSLLRRSRRGG